MSWYTQCIEDAEEHAVKECLLSQNKVDRAFLYYYRVILDTTAVLSYRSL